jgi:hypothetical protein
MTRVHGKLKRITLGRYSNEFGLANARDQARKVIADAQKGETPLTGRALRQAVAARCGDTVAAVLAEYVARRQRGKGRRTWRQVEQALTRELVAAGWLDRPLASIAGARAGRRQGRTLAS